MLKNDHEEQKPDKEISKAVRAANSAKEALWCFQGQDEEFLL